jgi:hypothetical protein
MPAVPESATLPSVEQNVGPLAQIHSPSPETLGGAIGEGFQSLGKATGQASDMMAQQALRVASLNNKAMSDAAYTGYLNDAGKLEAQFQMDNRSVDPSQVQQRYTDYVGNLEQLRQKYRSTLGNMMAQSEFDQNSRRMQGYMIMNGSRTMAAGAHAYRQAAFEGSQKTLMDRAAATADPAEQEELKQQIANGAYAWGHSEGLPDDAIKADILDRTSAVDMSVIDGMSRTDPEGAMTYFQAHRGEMTAEHIGATEAKLDQALTIHGGYIASQQALSSFNAGQGSTAAARPAGGDHRTLAQIEHDESGGRNIVNYREQRGERGFTASGYYQITDPTWREFAPPDVVAKYPRAMNAPRAIQTQVATIMQQKTGNTRWAESAPSGYMPGSPGAQLDNLQANAHSILQMADANADAYAKQWGLDPIMVRYQAEQRTESEINRQEFQVRQEEESSKQNILTAISAGDSNGEPLGDMPTLFRLNPGLQNDFNNLTGSDRRAVQSYLRQGANQLTPQRQDEERRLLGMDSQTYLQQNPMDPKLDLTTSQRTEMIHRQAALRQDVIKQQQHDARINTITSNKVIHAGLVDAGIVDSNNQISDPASYQMFVGRMMQAEEAWAAQHPTHKGPIPDQDMVNLATPLLARRGVQPPMQIFGINVPFTGSRGEVPAQIPPDRYGALHDQFVQQFGFEPSPEQIGHEYELRRERGLEH